jgi:putative membrane protein
MRNASGTCCLGAGATMVSNSDDTPDDTPDDAVEPTEAFVPGDLQAELPTEEARRVKPPALDDGPTRSMPRIQPPGTIGNPTEQPAPEATVGIHLEELEVSETVGFHLEISETVGLHLEEAEPLPTEPSLQRSPPLDTGSAGTLHEAETILVKDTPWQGLHPISLAVNLVPRAWNTIRSMWPILLFVVIGGEGAGIGFIELFVILLFTLASVWNTFVHWVTLRYRIHNGRLEITSGLLNRRARTIDPARIQNVELVQNLFHTWAGLVELRIDTAGESSTEGLLSALSVEDATALRNTLAEIGSLAAASRDDAQESTPLVTMGWAEILAFGLTQRTIGTVAVLTAVGLEIMNQAGPELTADFTVNMQPAMIVAAFMLAFVASWTVSALSSVFRFFDYRMIRLPDAIRTEQGLTTKRRVEIPLSKVQMVRADEPLMRRLMGYGTLLIETAGLGVIEGQMRQAEGMVPMVERQKLGYIAAQAVPHAEVDPWTAELKPAHPRSLYRSIVGASIRAGLLISLAFTFLGPLKWVTLAVLPISLVGAWLDWRKQGWLVTPTAIVSRRGFFNRRTFILSRDKLQSIHFVQGPLMRLHGLSCLVVRVAGSQISLPETGAEDTAWLMVEMGQQSA